MKGDVSVVALKDLSPALVTRQLQILDLFSVPGLAEFDLFCLVVGGVGGAVR